MMDVRQTHAANPIRWMSGKPARAAKVALAALLTPVCLCANCNAPAVPRVPNAKLATDSATLTQGDTSEIGSGSTTQPPAAGNTNLLPPPCGPTMVKIAVDGKPLCAPDYPAWGVGPLNPTGFIDNGDGTVVHALTGLMWQQEPGQVGLMTSDAVSAYCDPLVIGGHTDWRLPTLAELYSAYFYDSFCHDVASAEPPPLLPKNDWQTFPGNKHFPLYWTASTDDSSPPWHFGLYDHCQLGSGGPSSPGSVTPPRSGRVRCVRGGKPLPTSHSRFQIFGSAEEMVRDTATNLVWQRYEGPEVSWSDAMTACGSNAAKLPGTGWRMPNVRELGSIVDRQRPTSPYLDSKIFPGQDKISGCCWSSTVSSESWRAADLGLTVGVWNFNAGGPTSITMKTIKHLPETMTYRCVADW